MITHSDTQVKGHMEVVTTKLPNVRRIPFRGGDYVDRLMAELSRAGIAQRIQLARKQAGFTQRDFAVVMSVHPNTIQNWESRKIDIIPWDRLGEIAGVTGASREWLIHGDPEPGEDPEPLLRTQVVDAIQGLQEGQDEFAESLLRAVEGVLGRLDAIVAALSRLEGSLSRPRARGLDRDTGGESPTDSASARPQ